jgi:hypothetical protein
VSDDTERNALYGDLISPLLITRCDAPLILWHFISEAKGRWQVLDHDCTFECVAQTFVVEEIAATIPAALTAIRQRLMD